MWNLNNNVVSEDVPNNLSGGDSKQPKSRTCGTKKFNCPAQIVFKEILTFPDYKMKENGSRRDEYETGQRLKADYVAGKAKMVRYIYMSEPAVNDHRNHALGQAADMLQGIDRRLVDKIYELVFKGVQTIEETQCHLENFVADNLRDQLLLSPEKTNRRFYPTRKVIHNHMMTGRRKMMEDQEDLGTLIQIWADEHETNNYFYRPFIPANKDGSVPVTPFLLVCQSTEQQRLMQLYGNYICVLDAAYRACRYDLALYFVVVKTNSEYQVVGMFLMPNESSDGISEALVILKSWNVHWCPSTWLVDNCVTEIDATKLCFPASVVLLCDYHCERAWERFLNRVSNGLTAKERPIIKSMLHNIAQAETVADYELECEKLQQCAPWQGPAKQLLRDLVLLEWLAKHEMWVWAYRKDRFFCNMNADNGTQRMNEFFEHTSLKVNRQLSLTMMVRTLLTEFLPATYDMYHLANVDRSSKHEMQSNTVITVPRFLWDKPADMTATCIRRHEAGCSIPESCVIRLVDGTFNVQGCKVKLGDTEQMPSCTCHQWRHSMYPCKHMFAVFATGKAAFSDLSTMYLSLPFFNLDAAVISDVANADEYNSDTTTGPGSDNHEENIANSIEPPLLHNAHAPSKSWQSKCLELLRDVSSDCYLLTEPALMELHEKLKVVKSFTVDNIPVDERTISVSESRKTTPKRQTTPKRKSTSVRVPAPRKKNKKKELQSSETSEQQVELMNAIQFVFEAK